MDFDFKTVLILVVIVVAGCTIADTMQRHIEKMRLLNQGLVSVNLATPAHNVTARV